MLQHAVTAWRIATQIHYIHQAWKDSGCYPVDANKVINDQNFPGLDNGDMNTPSPPRKRRRNGFNISNRTLTANCAIAELRERESS